MVATIVLVFGSILETLFLGLLEIQMLPPIATQSGDPATAIFARACKSDIGRRTALRSGTSAKVPLTAANSNKPHEKQMAFISPGMDRHTNSRIRWDLLRTRQDVQTGGLQMQFYHNP